MKILLLLACLSITSVTIAQDKEVQNKKTASENIYTSLKPADGTPVVFNSQEDLNAKIQTKKNNVLALIKENAGDSVQVKILREQLWRFENATVKAANNNK